MKKSIVAVGVIAILGIGYVGASWYTGNVIESKIDDKLEQIAEEFNNYQPQFDVAIDYSDYQKNIFSTKFHLTINISPKDGFGSREEQKTIFNDDVTIHHGPFPIAALAKGKFAPQMAWAEYEMTEKASPELWKLAGNKPFITGYMGMSYQEYFTLKLVNTALNSNGSDEQLNKLDVSSGEFSFEGNKDFSDLLIDANLNKLSFSEQDSDEFITLNNFTLSAKPNSEKTGIDYTLGLGDFSFTSESYYSTSSIIMNNIKSQGSVVYANQNIDSQTTIDKITYTPETRENKKDQTIVINQLNINQKSKSNDANPDTLDGELVASIESLLIGQQNLGNGLLDFNYQGVDEKFASRNFMGHSYGYDESSENNGPVNMKLSLNKFSWHNAAGDIQTSANVALSGEKLDNLDIENIDALNIKLDVPFAVLAQFSAQVENPKATTITPEQLTEANQSMQMMAGVLLRRSPVITFKKGETNGIYSDVSYSKGDEEVQVNGNKINKEEFFEKF